MSIKERVGLWTHFIFFLSDRGDQLGPPLPKGGRYERVPMASTSYRTKDENDTLVGDVSMMSCGGVNPIGGDGQTMPSYPLMSVDLRLFVKH